MSRMSSVIQAGSRVPCSEDCKGHGEGLSWFGEPHSPVAEQTCAGARALFLPVSPLWNLEKIAPIIRASDSTNSIGSSL